MLKIKPFNITIIQVDASTSNTEEAEVEQFCEDLVDLLELTPPKNRYPFHYRGMECKSRKSRNTWSNRQIWTWRERIGHSKHPFPTMCREDSKHGHHQTIDTEIRLIISFAAKDGDALYSQQIQDQELTVAQIMNSLLPNSDWNWRKWGKPLDHSGIT